MSRKALEHEKPAREKTLCNILETQRADSADYVREATRTPLSQTQITSGKHENPLTGVLPIKGFLLCSYMQL